MERRPEKTAADYMAIAIAPVLIMVLVGALVFFLVEIIYRDSVPEGLRWVLFWFVLASVLVTRVAIGVDSDRAVIYALGLGGATALWIVRFIEPPFAAIGLLGVVWWCANKLTWSCTFIDDEEDASGVGLLRVADPTQAPASDAPSPETKPAVASVAGASTLASRERVRRAVKPVAPEKTRRRVAAVPGLWVVYFSIGALPLFGVGQALLPAHDAGRRFHAVVLLTFYLAAALGLLLVTSFLGLRRYLRQRGVQMPASIAFDWLARGALVAGVVLAACVLLPRPDAVYSLSALAAQAGKRAPGPGASGRGTVFGAQPSQGGGRMQPAGDGASAPANANRSSPAAGSPTQRPGAEGALRADGSSDAPGPVGDGGPGGQALGQAGGQTARSAAAAAPLGVMLKWIVYGVFGAIGLVLLVRHGRALWRGLVELWTDLRALWGRLFRIQSRAKTAPVSSPKQREPRLFSAFEDPFRSGRSNRSSPEELARYTFEALQAWAIQYELARGAEETPLEFGERLALAVPEMAGPVAMTTRAYAALAYAGRAPDRRGLEAMRQVWLAMTGHA